ncbi:MAG: sulfatase [Armatimonadota bacterium]|nr:sulfatase [Armatimonadota bacterium]
MPIENSLRPRMLRREFLKRSAASVAAVTLLGDEAFAASAPRRPSFVLINCDDLGYSDVGCYGSELIATPNIDALAQTGVKFTDFYAAAAVCTPSRACLMTGRYFVRPGLPRVLFPRDKVGITDKEITVAQILKRQGYATACIGKWHLGHLPRFLPTRHGFDYYYGIPYSNDMDKKQRNEPPTPLMRNEKIIEQPAVQETLTERYTEEAVNFIEQNKDHPFFVYLPHTMPHVPLHVSERFKGRSKRGLYGDVVETIDWGVGEIVKTLKDLGLQRDTLVMFTSDNGPWLQQKDHGGSAGPLRAGKATAYEGGHREPFIANWPGRIPAGSICADPASNLDILPTLASLAGTKAPTDRIIDGRDITPLLLCKDDMDDYPFFYMRNWDVCAVRYGKWKLHVRDREQQLEAIELYDLRADIGETTNLAGRYPKMVDKLKAMIAEFCKTLPPPPKAE